MSEETNTELANLLSQRYFRAEDVCDKCLMSVGKRFESRTYQLMKTDSGFVCVHVCKYCFFKEKIPAKGM